MLKAHSSDHPPSAIDDYIALPRMDRMAIYRSLSVSDRMRLDRQIKDRKIQQKKKLRRTPVVEKINSIDDQTNIQISPWLQTHLDTILNNQGGNLGEKTVEFVKAYADKDRNKHINA